MRRSRNHKPRPLHRRKRRREFEQKETKEAKLIPQTLRPAAARAEPRPTGLMKTRRSPARFHSIIIQAGALGSLSLNPDLIRATGVCSHVDLFTSVRIDDLERGGRIIQPHRLDLGIDREGVSDG
jgi:hypothetical protein